MYKIPLRGVLYGDPEEILRIIERYEREKDYPGFYEFISNVLGLIEAVEAGNVVSQLDDSYREAA
ncbi:MAG: hypothetical protein AAGF15_08255 [Pseudomonadota bacterium]